MWSQVRVGPSQAVALAIPLWLPRRILDSRQRRTKNTEVGRDCSHQACGREASANGRLRPLADTDSGSLPIDTRKGLDALRWYQVCDQKDPLNRIEEGHLFAQGCACLSLRALWTWWLGDDSDSAAFPLRLVRVGDGVFHKLYNDMRSAYHYVLFAHMLIIIRDDSLPHQL